MITDLIRRLVGILARRRGMCEALTTGKRGGHRVVVSTSVPTLRTLASLSRRTNSRLLVVDGGRISLLASVTGMLNGSSRGVAIAELVKCLNARPSVRTGLATTHSDLVRTTTRVGRVGSLGSRLLTRTVRLARFSVALFGDVGRTPRATGCSEGTCGANSVLNDDNFSTGRWSLAKEAKA